MQVRGGARGGARTRTVLPPGGFKLGLAGFSNAAASMACPLIWTFSRDAVAGYVPVPSRVGESCAHFVHIDRAPSGHALRACDERCRARVAREITSHERVPGGDFAAIESAPPIFEVGRRLSVGRMFVRWCLEVLAG
jgi:hypothetical protein